jgi:soluble lytic murein transglycosylase
VFYAAILAEHAPDGEKNRADAAALYRTALGGNPVVREEAARRLLPLLPEFPDPDLLSRLVPALPAPWGRALAQLAGRAGTDTGTNPEAAAVFLSEPVDPLYLWALERAGGAEGPLFTKAESAAVAGRLSLARSAFAPALEHFRAALEAEPALFFRYPELLTGLGRSFQFGDNSGAGTELFLEWEESLRDPEPAAAMPPAAGQPVSGQPGPAGMPDGPARSLLAYRLLYFAGRIERQRGRHETATGLFSRAVEKAPDALQADACIWYILSMALRDRPGEVAGLLETWIPRWHRAADFDDILDRLARHLASQGSWQALLEVYRMLKPGPARAQYGYILGRASEAGYFGGARPEEFYRTVFDEKQGSFYYQAISALKLGRALPAPPGPDPAVSPGQAPGFSHPELMEFLLGFFGRGASEFALPYITKYRQELRADELRALAEALQKAGIWDESIRLAGFYMDQDGYEPTRGDLELCYPRPFLEPVEEYAGEFGIPPWLLFGLIRTESAFAPGIGSRAGAVGLTQLMPDTAAEMAGRLARQGGADYRREGGVDLTDPRANIHLGAFYLRYLLGRMQNPLLALLAYNGGMGRVRRWRAEAPELPADLFVETAEFAETREYVRKVAAAAAVYGFLYYDLTVEAVIADILK